MPHDIIQAIKYTMSKIKRNKTPVEKGIVMESIKIRSIMKQCSDSSTKKKWKPNKLRKLQAHKPFKSP